VNLRPFEAKSWGRYRSSDQISSPHWHLSIRTVFPVREFSIDLPWIRTAPQRLHVRNGAALTLRAVSASDFSLTSPSSKSTQAVSASEPVIRNRPLVVTISRSCVRTFSNPHPDLRQDGSLRAPIDCTKSNTTATVRSFSVWAGAFGTRNGYDWSDRFPLITEAARRIRLDSFVIDGEAVLLGVDGISDFKGLHSRTPMRFSFTPSTFWRLKVMTCASCRCTCGRTTLPGSWRGGWMASSSMTSNAVKSAPIYYAPPAT
jgi:hypothetical protein